MATSFTSGEVIRNAKVTQRGIPALKNPINKGIDEQVQNGVIAPNKEAKKYSNQKSLFLTKNSFTFFVGK